MNKVKAVFAALALFVSGGAVLAAPAVTPLVDSAWLADNLQADNLVIIDVRSGIDGTNAEGFAAGHIPGSVYASYTDGGWRTSVNGVPGMTPGVEELQTYIQSLGVSNDDAVVIVPAGVGSTDFGSAARVYWTFKLLGHDAVGILNGGLKGWVDAGGELATGQTNATAGNFTANLRPELLVSAEQVQAGIDGGSQLVDARPAAQFRGEAKHPASANAGTIPGAASLEEHLLVQEGSSNFVDAAEVSRLVDAAGIDGSEPIVSFCNTGHWAATVWFALSEVAGLESVAMYDGSMTEWTQDPNRPLVAGQQALSDLLN